MNEIREKIAELRQLDRTLLEERLRGFDEQTLRVMVGDLLELARVQASRDGRSVSSTSVPRHEFRRLPRGGDSDLFSRVLLLRLRSLPVPVIPPKRVRRRRG